MRSSERRLTWTLFFCFFVFFCSNIVAFISKVNVAVGSIGATDGVAAIGGNRTASTTRFNW